LHTADEKLALTARNVGTATSEKKKSEKKSLEGQWESRVEGATTPGDTLQGATPDQIFLWLNLVLFSKSSHKKVILVGCHPVEGCHPG